MKKAITTILSALLLISCLTVNVFATNSEGEDSGNLSATQTSSSETNEEYQATQYSENVESMNLVIPGSDDNNTIVPLTKRAVDENNSSYEWYISPDLEMFTQRNYLDFCKSVANKEQNFYLQYTPANGETQTVQSANISISGPGNSNDVKRTATVFETTVVFAEYTKNLLYARSVYFDNNEIRFSDYTPTSQDGPINIEIYNNQRYLLYYGNDYDSNASTDDIVLNRNTEGISIGTNENFNINVTENNVFEVSSTHSGSSVSVSYADQTLTFTSVLPNVGVFSSTERSDSTYCTSYNDSNRVFYINWDNNSVSSISLNAIRRNNNYTYESNEYKRTLMENANSLKIEFNDGVNIEGGLEIQLTINPRYGNSYPYNPRIDYEPGNTLYARNTFYGENDEIKFNEHAQTPFNGDIFVDIYNNQQYALYFGSNYDNNVSPESERISDVTVSQNNGMTISELNGLLSVYSERSDSYATITYEGKSLTFRSRLPEVGIYTSSVIADETYCAKYNSSRRDFYLNWNNNNINSVSVMSISGYEPNTTYGTDQYSIEPNNNSLKLSFIKGVDITKGGLSIKVSVNYKNGQSNEFYIGCRYDSEYIENADYIIRDNQIFYSTVYNNRTYYVSKDIFSKFDSIKDNFSINEQTQNILISFSNTDNYEMNNNSVFFDHGAYFRIDKIVSLSAYNVSNPTTDELTDGNKISFTNPIVLDINYRNTSLDYTEVNTYLFTEKDGIYNKTYDKVSNNSNQGNITLQTNEYCWYGNQYATSIKLSSNFNDPIVFATRLYDSDFKAFNDNFSTQTETISSQEDLQNKIDLQFTVGGSVLKLGDNITLNKDLRITNFADFSMNDVSSNNFENSLLIDLNEKTINLGSFKIVISENSTVHIRNGIIVGNSDSLIDNYGGLSLHDVDLKNNSNSENSYAIKTYRGAVFVDENTTINSYNGINLSDSYYYRTFDNSCLVSGSINVEGNGIVFEEKETFNQDFLNVMVPNYINQEIQNNNYQVLEDIEPKVVAKGVAINAANKTNIMIAGTSYQDNNNNEEYAATTTIQGSTAIMTKSGTLDIGGNTLIESKGQASPNIEVFSGNINNDLMIDINVSQKTNFKSLGSVIAENGRSDSRNITLNIYCDQHVNDSKFIYGENSNPFVFNSNKISKNISSGFYSNNLIDSHLSNDYISELNSNGYYEVKVNSNDPTDYTFDWDTKDNVNNNLARLSYFCNNLGTKNININTFSDFEGTHSITITKSKNISINNNITLKNIKFVVNAEGQKVHFNNGNLVNDTEQCLVVENGEVFVNTKLVSNGSKETIKVTGGKLHFDPGASAKGNVALNIEATNSVPKIDVCGDLEGTSGVAIKYVISDDLTVDYDNYALNIVGQNNPNGHSTIKGGILAKNGKVTTMHTNIVADVAFELKGNSQLVFGKDTHVTGNEVGVFLNGSGTFFFDEGTLESKHPVEILDKSDGEYQVVFMDRVRCKVLENGSGRVINTINDKGIIQNTNERISYNASCELAYFNVPVDEKQFNNLNMKMNQVTPQKGMYTSVQYDSLSADYPYCIAYKLDSVKHNSLSLNFTNNNDIKVEASKLDGLKQNQGNNEWTLLVIEEAKIPESSDNLIEAYDIQVRDIDENKNVSLISETSDYQIIIIPVKTDNIEKVNIGHKHGDDPETILAKVSKQDALSNPRECYFVNNDSSVGIITKRFSTFGIYSNDNVILPEASAIESPQATPIEYGQKLEESTLSGEWRWLNPDTEPVAGEHNYDVYLTVTNSDKYDYSKIDGYDPTTNRIVRTITITVNKATPIYNPTGLTATYNDTLSVIALDQGWQWLEPDRVLTEIGEVTAKAKVNETDNYLASEKDLTITVTKKQASVPPIPTTIPVVYGVTLADVTLSDSNWNWVDNTIKPTVTNNGYQVYINVDDTHYNWEDIDGYDSTKHRYVANISVTVSKADPIDVNPGTLNAVYGDKLSQFKLTGGWYWENGNIVFNNIGSMTVIAKIDATDNYKSSTKEVTVTVNKKKAEIPVKPTAKSVVYGVTLADISLSDSNWHWVDNTIKPTVTNNGYKAYIEVDDTHYNWTGIDGYDSVKHIYVTTLSVEVSKAVQDKTKVTVPVIKNVEKGTLLEKIELPANWKWEKSSNVVGDSNYAIYNPDDANYVDLLISIPVSIKETVGDKTVSISNTVSSSDEKGIEEVAVKNDGISKSVVDAVANTADTNTKINNKDVTDLIKAADSTTSLNISTEFIKNTVTKEEDISNAISKADVKADEVAMVLDLEIKIKVNNGTTEKEGNITELAEPVELTFKLPEGSKTTAAEGKELKYYVLVIHGDDVLKIPATLNAADGTVTFSADKFSTYILVSEEVTKAVVENSTPSYVPSANKKPVVNTAAK